MALDTQKSEEELEVDPERAGQPKDIGIPEAESNEAHISGELRDDGNFAPGMELAQLLNSDLPYLEKKIVSWLYSGINPDSKIFIIKYKECFNIELADPRRIIPGRGALRFLRVCKMTA